MVKVPSLKRDAESIVSILPPSDRLERVLQCKFDLTVVCSGVGYAVSARHIGIGCRQTEIGMIEKVEKFGSELHLLRLSNFEVLLQHHVEVDQVWSPQISDPRVSKQM